MLLVRRRDAADAKMNTVALRRRERRSLSAVESDASSRAGRRRRACADATHAVGVLARRGRREDESFGATPHGIGSLLFALISPCARARGGRHATAKFGATDAGAQGRARVGM